MARTTTQLRDVVLAEGGFDSTLWSTAAVGWLNEAHQELVAEARWRFADDYSITTTVADQSVYTLTDDAVSIDWVEVDGTRYERASGSWMDRLHDETATSSPSDQGWWSEAANATGATKQIRLYPTPDETGLAITARLSLIPTDLDTTSVNPVIPEDLEGALISGAIAKGLMRSTDQRPDLVPAYQQQFVDGVERLRRRRKSRTAGSGPVSVPVRGIHFR